MAFSSNFEETIDLVASGAKVAGTIALIGGNLGMWLNDVADGSTGPFKIRGRLNVVDKTASQVWTAGEPLYWDSGTSKFTNIPNGTPVVAVVAAAALSAATVGDVVIGEQPNYGAGGETFEITSELLAASVDKWMFVATRPCKVVAVRECHSVIGGSGAVVRPRKITAATTAAPGAAVAAGITELTAADIGLETAVNVAQNAGLTATVADLSLAAGDKIGLNFGGTLTGLVGVLTIELQYI